MKWTTQGGSVFGGLRYCCFPGKRKEAAYWRKKKAIADPWTFEDGLSTETNAAKGNRLQETLCIEFVISTVPFPGVFFVEMIRH